MDMYNQAVGFRNSLKQINYWKRKIIDLENELKDELMMIDHQRGGLSHRGIELSEEQARSGKPMPTSSNHGQGVNQVGLIEKKDKVRKEYQEKIKHYQYMIDDVYKVLDEMNEDDRSLVIEMYVNHKYTFEYIAASRYTSVSNIKRIANKAINKATSKKLDSEPQK